MQIIKMSKLRLCRRRRFYSIGTSRSKKGCYLFYPPSQTLSPRLDLISANIFPACNIHFFSFRLPHSLAQTECAKLLVSLIIKADVDPVGVIHRSRTRAGPLPTSKTCLLSSGLCPLPPGFIHHHRNSIRQIQAAING